MARPVSVAAIFVALVPALLVLAPSPAEAHKLNVFAYVDNGQIVGEVYARGGETIAGATITAWAVDGAELAQAVTDGEGNFRFPARFRAAHRLVADAGEGHTAEYTVPEAEMPASLPAYTAGSTTAATPATAPSKPAAAVARSAENADSAQGRASSADTANGNIADLAKQIGQLRQDLDRFQREMRFQDVMGGVGYILGMIGLGGYLLRRRQRP